MMKGILLGICGFSMIFVLLLSACSDSDSGITWTIAREANGVNLNAVAYGGGKFVAVGKNGKILYSSDGVKWTEAEDKPFGYKEIEDVCYGDGKFVAVNLSSENNVAVSTDGVTWSSGKFPGSDGYYCITYGDGKFIAVTGGISFGGSAAYSSDGITWTPITDELITDSAFITDITYGKGKFIISRSNRKPAYSSDGLEWTQIDFDIHGSESFICYAGDKYFAGGTDNLLSYSSDGIAWTPITDKSLFVIKVKDVNVTWQCTIQKVAYGGGKYVAVGGMGQTIYSSNGKDWKGIEYKTLPFHFFNILDDGLVDICYGDGKFVAVATGGYIVYGN